MIQSDKLSLNTVPADTTLPQWCQIVRKAPEQFERGAFLRAQNRLMHSRDVYAFLKPRFDREEVEVFVAVYVDAHGQVLGVTEIARGSFESVPADPRTVFRVGIALGAYGVYLAHNHPTGDPTPSGNDIGATDRMREAGHLLGVEVLDALVIGDGRYVSIRDHQMKRLGGYLDNIADLFPPAITGQNIAGEDKKFALPVAAPVTTDDYRFENHGKYVLAYALNHRAREELRKVTRGQDVLWYGDDGIVVDPLYLEEFAMALTDDGFKFALA